MSVLIRNARDLSAADGADTRVDVLVLGERIEQVGPAGTIPPERHPGTKLFDAAGRWLLGGVTDLWTELREPGFEWEEDVATGTRAAAAGGVTRVLAIPDTTPVMDHAEALVALRRRADEVGSVAVSLAGTLTAQAGGKQLSPVAELRGAGAVALSDGARWTADAAVMRRALEYSTDFGLVVMSSPLEPNLAHGGVMREGPTSMRLGLRGIPRVAEEVALARDLALAAETRAKLHVGPLASARAVELVRSAKASGVDVTASCSAHHLVLTAEAVVGYGTATKLRPPLGTEADREALIAAVLDGTLDAVVSAHAPRGVLVKDTTFDQAAFGASGVETLLPLALGLARALPARALPRLAHALTAGPARVLGLEPVRLVAGARADLTVYDPARTWTVSRATWRSKSLNTPWLGRALTGAAVLTLVGGRTVHQSESTT